MPCMKLPRTEMAKVKQMFIQSIIRGNTWLADDKTLMHCVFSCITEF